jgi:predicted Zn finger-like uncharacterized protein
MIINCINCDKKFEVDSSQIPDSGRNVQCGLCNHTWFYKKDLDKSKIIKKVKKNYLDEDTILNKTNRDYKSDKIDQNQINEEIKTAESNQKDKVKTHKKTSSGMMGKILSYLVVGIISFITLVIFLDTFKSPLTKILPGLELFLYNLFETIKDIFLFIKNLIV